MKHLLILLFFFIAGVLSAQEEKTNRFIEEEKIALPEESMSTMRSGDPPNDPDLPIDDYIPYLISTAIILIVFSKYKRTSFRRFVAGSDEKTGREFI